MEAVGKSLDSVCHEIWFFILSVWSSDKRLTDVQKLVINT